VRDHVVSETGARQEPFVYGSLSSEAFYLVPPSEPVRPPVEQTREEPETEVLWPRPRGNEGAFELAFWDSIKDSEDPRLFEAYLGKYPEGEFAPIARLKIEQMTAEGAVVTLRQEPVVSPAEDFEVEEGDDILVVARNAIVRSGPSTDHERIGQLDAGSDVLVTGKVRDRDWYRIALSKGGDGFMWAPLLVEPSEYAWAAIEESTYAFDFETFLEGFPESPMAPLARLRLEELQEAESAALVAPPRPTSTEGRTFRDCPECPEMVVIPAGSFMMGTSDAEIADLVSEGGEADSHANETPRHQVAFPRPFAVGRREVTFAEWDACVAAGGCGHWPGDEGQGRGERPVINVSWDDAQEYVRWLSERTSSEYRLLSEAEWEHAARAGSETRHWWGDAIGHDNANCDGCGSLWDNEQPAPVGSFAANPFGLHDMAGNVWEWVEDCYHDSYSGAPSDGSAWTSGGDCDMRVARGGSWYSYPVNLRSASRARDQFGARDAYSGFRVAATLSEEKLAALPEAAFGVETAEVAPVLPLPEALEPLVEPGAGFRDCPECPEMVMIPAGGFMMGSGDAEIAYLVSDEGDDAGSHADETPRHQVTFARPFAVGRTEVTFAEWDACVAAGGCSHRPGDEGWGRGERPVINVSWDDAQEYVRWLSRRTSHEYRLLSEAEWEYAARAGTETNRWWGDAIGQGNANCDGCGSRWDNEQTAPVGSFAANPLGLYDVLGNVREWVEDCYADGYSDAPSDGSVWAPGAVCEYHVMRGGSWYNTLWLVRSASRWLEAETRDSQSGFRVARTLAEQF
jgi:formylglycine-generating enzyme required for sulfatase activity